MTSAKEAPRKRTNQLRHPSFHRVFKVTILAPEESAFLDSKVWEKAILEALENEGGGVELPEYWRISVEEIE